MAEACPCCFRSALYRLPGSITSFVPSSSRSRSALPVRFSPHWKSKRLQSAPLSKVLFPWHAILQVAQAILADIATSIMTVVAMVFAILSMARAWRDEDFPIILISLVGIEFAMDARRIPRARFYLIASQHSSVQVLAYAFMPAMSRLMLKSAKRASLIENLRSLRGLGKMRVR